MSRLELELKFGRNETGIYECRAMNVVAREPVVGTYTLLVLPAHYAVIPMQPPVVGGYSGELPENGISPEASQESSSLSSQTTTTTTTAQAQATTQTQTTSSSSSSIASIAIAATSTPTTTTLAPQQAAAAAAADQARQQQQQQQQQIIANDQSNSNSNSTSVKTSTSTSTSMAPTLAPTQTILAQNTSSVSQLHLKAQEPMGNNSIHEPPLVVGRPCPKEAHENFCLNKGTCVLIEHIEEYFCK